MSCAGRPSSADRPITSLGLARRSYKSLARHLSVPASSSSVGRPPLRGLASGGLTDRPRLLTLALDIRISAVTKE